MEKNISLNNLITYNSKINEKLQTINTSLEEIMLKNGDLANLSTTNKTDLVQAINEVFQDVSNGKSLIATAITDKGTEANGDETFADLSYKISSIYTGLIPTTGNLFVKELAIRNHEVGYIDVAIVKSNDWFITHCIPVKFGATYRKNINHSGDSVLLFDADKMLIGSDVFVDGAVIITNADVRYIMTNSELTNINTYLLMEESTEALTNVSDDTIINPYENSVYINTKMQTHCHSTSSDGAQDTTTVVNAYLNAGYGNLTVTNHDYVSDPWGSESFTGIKGVEESESSMHIGAIGITSQSTTASNNTQRILYHRGNNPNAIIVLHHPKRGTGFSDIDLASLDYDCIEIYNGSDKTNYEQAWDYALSSGKRVWGICSDDCHDVTNVNNFNTAWSNILSMPNETDILSAMKKGQFYACKDHDIEVGYTNNVIQAKSSKLSNFQFITKNGVVIKTENNVLQSTYEIENNAHTYIRIKSTLASDTTKYACSQPMFLKKDDTEIEFTYEGLGSFNEDGTEKTSTSSMRSNYISVSENERYKFTGSIDWVIIVAYDDLDQIIESNITYNTDIDRNIISYTAPANATKIRFKISNDLAHTVKMFKVLNIENSKGITWVENSNLNSTTGVPTSQPDMFRTEFIEYNPNEKHTINFYEESSYRVYFYTSDGTFISRTDDILYNAGDSISIGSLCPVNTKKYRLKTDTFYGTNISNIYSRVALFVDSFVAWTWIDNSNLNGTTGLPEFNAATMHTEIIEYNPTDKHVIDFYATDRFRFYFYSSDGTYMSRTDTEYISGTTLDVSTVIPEGATKYRFKVGKDNGANLTNIHDRVYLKVHSYVQDGLDIYLDSRDIGLETNVWNDLSGNDHHFDMINFTDLTVVDGGIVFDGVNQHLANTTYAPMATNKENLTIEFYGGVKIASSGYDAEIFSIGYTSASGYEFSSNNGSLRVKGYSTSTLNLSTAFSGSTINDIKHIVLRHTTNPFSRVELFVDGIFINSIDDTGDRSYISECRIGTCYDIDSFAEMNLKQFRIYKRALTDGEIAQNYNYCKKIFLI